VRLKSGWLAQNDGLIRKTHNSLGAVSPGSGREGRIFLGKQAGIGEAVVMALPEDYVVEHTDAEDLRSFNQPVGAIAVLMRGGRVTTRMIVDKDDRRRAVQQCGFEAFSWMNDRCRQASNADSVVADGPVLRIKGNST
jgi:hypothetical protein